MFLRSLAARETKPATSCSGFSTIGFWTRITKDVEHPAAHQFYRRRQSFFAPRHGPDKMALGESGKDMVALAAADYFFDTKYKRAVMENFTNLVPMERTGSLRQSLATRAVFLDRGYNALIFPEGTRS